MHVSLRLITHLRERETVPDLWLLFAPVKRGRIDWIAEKATELGVARLVPVLTQRTIVDRVNMDRLRAHIIEAAEQCERTAFRSSPSRGSSTRCSPTGRPSARCSSPTNKAARPSPRPRKQAPAPSSSGPKAVLPTRKAPASPPPPRQ